MKKILFYLLVSSLLGAFSQSITAQVVFPTATGYTQCDRATYSPIQCGYYEEGYMDGYKDAQANRTFDNKRYQDKIDSRRYEDFYRRGYQAGYSSIKPYAKWDSTQRDAYDNGYKDGDSDHRRNISRLPERYEGDYNNATELYYKQGYYDGYDGRSKQYDTQIGAQGNNPGGNFPGIWGPDGGQGGSRSGTVSWNGRVDNLVNINIQGSNVQNQLIAGTFGDATQSMTGSLPRRAVLVTVRKLSGRGTANVVQQPNRQNNFTAIVQVSDPKSGADNYRLEISWGTNQAAPVDEPYQSGKATWSGKVDQTVNVMVAGSDVQTQDASGTGVSDTTYGITGYLARRPGTVTVKKIKGRGTVSVVEQPSYENDYTAVIRIFDPDKGRGDYQIEISW